MPKTSAQTSTATSALPTQTVAGAPAGNSNTVVVHVDLTFDGVNFSPEGLRAALDAAYGTVTSDADGAERPLGPFRYRIAP